MGVSENSGRLDTDPGEPVAAAAPALRETQSDERGVGVGKRDPRAPAAARRDRSRALPVPPVVRELDVVAPREVGGVPVEREAAELAPPSQIEEQLLPLTPAGIGAPGARRRKRRIRRGELLEGQRRDPHRPGAAGRRGHGDLDETEIAQLAAVRGPPGERDLPLAIPERRPFPRELEVAPDRPPDVLPRAVQELELERLHGRIGAEREGDRPVLGERPRERLARRRPSRVAPEVEVQPQRAARGPRVGTQVQTDALRRRGDPAANPVERVEHHGVSPRRRRRARRTESARSPATAHARLTP